VRQTETHRPAEVLACVVRHVRDHGGSPTVRELCDALGMSPTSINAVVGHLRALRRKGLVELPAGVVARGVRVVGLADAVRAAVEAWASENGVEL
jgi:SOS-response transcriptional repressor LexA